MEKGMLSYQFTGDGDSQLSEILSNTDTSAEYFIRKSQEGGFEFVFEESPTDVEKYTIGDSGSFFEPPSTENYTTTQNIEASMPINIVDTRTGENVDPEDIKLDDNDMVLEDFIKDYHAITFKEDALNAKPNISSLQKTYDGNDELEDVNENGTTYEVEKKYQNIFSDIVNSIEKEGFDISKNINKEIPYNMLNDKSGPFQEILRDANSNPDSSIPSDVVLKLGLDNDDNYVLRASSTMMENISYDEEYGGKIREDVVASVDIPIMIDGGSNSNGKEVERLNKDSIITINTKEEPDAYLTTSTRNMRDDNTPSIVTTTPVRHSLGDPQESELKGLMSKIQDKAVEVSLEKEMKNEVKPTEPKKDKPKKSSGPSGP